MERQDWRELVDVLISRRQELHITQAALAAEIPNAQSTVASFEAKRHPASIQNFCRYANALDCKVVIIPIDKLSAFTIDDD